MILIQFCIISFQYFPNSFSLSLSLFHFPFYVVKKSGGYIIAGLLMAMGIAGPLALKALAVIAGKALIISKVALTIAAAIALKKIFSSHPDGRSFDELLKMPKSILDDTIDSLSNQNNDPYRFQHRAFRH